MRWEAGRDLAAAACILHLILSRLNTLPPYPGQLTSCFEQKGTLPLLRARPMSREEPATAAREVHRLLLKACFSKDLAALHRALAGCSADDTVHSGSAGGISAIHISPANLSHDVVAALSLPTGPSLGLSPLHAAVLTGFSPGAKMLLAAGAQPDART